MTVHIFVSKLHVVKGRRGGLKGALGSSFGNFRCAFSTCSPYLVGMRCILLNSVEVELIQ